MATQYRGFYAQYIDLPTESNPNGYITVSCPFKFNHTNGDKKPSAGVHVEKGIFSCARCGSMSAASFLSKLLELTLQKAIVIVDDYRRENKLVEKLGGFSNSYVANPRWAELHRASLTGLAELLNSEEIRMDQEPSSAYQAISEYSVGRGISLKTLQELGVGYLPAKDTNWERSSLVFPYFHNGKVIGLRYRDADGNKGGEKGCHFCLWGADKLDEKTRIAVIGEGESDTAILYQTLKAYGYGPEEGVRVVGTPSARFRHEWEREFEGIEHKVLVPQADDASQKLIEAAKRAIPDLHVLELPWRRGQIGKDTCEWLVDNQGAELAAFLETLVGRNKKLIMNGYELEEAADQEGTKDEQYIIGKLLQRRQILLQAGGPKSYKTWMMLEALRAVVGPYGTEFLGIKGMSRYREEPHKVLVVEEEGNLSSLRERAVLVLGDLEDWQSSVYWSHRSGLKLDDEGFIRKLEKDIERLGVDLLVLDPFQDLHSQDEDNATAMAGVWSNLKRLTARFPNLSIWIIHHFGKAKIIQEKWNALRGSSRNSASADVGIFQEKLPTREGLGCRFVFDGRELSPIEPQEGEDSFKAAFSSECRLTLASGAILINRHLALIEEMRRRKEWLLTEASAFFTCTNETITNWCKKAKVADNVSLTLPSKGNPVRLIWIGKEDR